MKKVLLLEDDPVLGRELHNKLKEHYEAHWTKTVSESLVKIKEENYDLVILDLGLPDGSGFDLLLKNKNLPPVVFLTAQSDAESRLQAYELGAKEFIPKPFHLKELLIRVRHVLEDHAPLKVLDLPQLQVNFSELSIKKNSGELEFPAVRDLRVLELLVSRAPQPVSRDQILDGVWGPDQNPSHRSVDNCIVRLKKLLGDEGEDYIRAVRGLGYQWVYGGSHRG